MNVTPNIVENLTRTGVRLQLLPGDLVKAEAPKGCLTADVKQALQDHKAVIVAELKRRRQAQVRNQLSEKFFQICGVLNPIWQPDKIDADQLRQLTNAVNLAILAGNEYAYHQAERDFVRWTFETMQARHSPPD